MTYFMFYDIIHLNCEVSSHNQNVISLLHVYYTGISLVCTQFSGGNFRGSCRARAFLNFWRMPQYYCGCAEVFTYGCQMKQASVSCCYTGSKDGIPSILVSNNGLSLVINTEFEVFLKKIGDEHVNSAPYHPAQMDWQN